MAGVVTMAVTDRTRLGVLVACTVGNIVSMTPTVHAVFGTFLMPLSEEFGWARAKISVVLGIMAVTCAIAYPILGRWIDRHGTRGLVVLGTILFGLAVMSLSLLIGALWQFYALFFLVSLFGSWISTPILSKTVADWYDEGRGTALGISAGGGNGIGAVLFPIIAAIVVSGYGWRAGYLAIGALILMIGVPTLVLLLHDAPGAAVQQDDPVCAADGMSLREAIGRPAFWLILFAVALGAGVTTAIFSHVVPILAERGVGIGLATAVVSVFALVTSAWQVAAGHILDRVPTPRVVAPMYAMAIAGLALLEWGSGTPVLIAAGALLGVALGAQFGALPYFVARYFGMAAFGSIIGVLYSAVIAAQGITPVLLDAAFDVQGTYIHAVTIASLLLAGGTVLILFMPPYRVAAAPAEFDAAPAGIA